MHWEIPEILHGKRLQGITGKWVKRKLHVYASVGVSWFLYRVFLKLNPGRHGDSKSTVN